METLIYDLNHSSLSQIITHLELCNDDFIPPLSERVHIPDYANKIFMKAIRFEALSNQTLVGLVAQYVNIDGSEAFITSVSVLKSYMGRGVASKLLQQSREHAKANKIKKIKLEVNKKATQVISLYKKNGFSEYLDNIENIFMKINIFF